VSHIHSQISMCSGFSVEWHVKNHPGNLEDTSNKYTAHTVHMLFLECKIIVSKVSFSVRPTKHFNSELLTYITEIPADFVVITEQSHRVEWVCTDHYKLRLVHFQPSLLRSSLCVLAVLAAQTYTSTSTLLTAATKILTTL